MTKVMMIESRGIINSLNSIARIFCFLSSALADEKGYEVVAVCNELKAGMPAYTMSENVRFVNLARPTNSKIKNLCLKIKKTFRMPLAMFTYRKFIKKEKPDVIIIFDYTDVINVIFSQRKCKKIPVIAMTHYAFFPYGFTNPVKETLKEKIQKSFLKKVSAIQVLMPSFIDIAKNRYKVPACRIPNAVMPVSDEKLAVLEREKKKIIYVARIHPSKQYDLLIRAFAKVASDFPDWILEFWGDYKKAPELTERLNELIAGYNLKERILWKGTTANVEEIYRNADICAFPSAHEGFPLALSEAMSYGLPAVGLKQAVGVNELIKNEETGFLVKDIDDFADKLRLLMQDKGLRIKMGKQAKEDMKNYAPKKIVDEWDKLIKLVVS